MMFVTILQKANCPNIISIAVEIVMLRRHLHHGFRIAPEFVTRMELHLQIHLIVQEYVEVVRWKIVREYVMEMLMKIAQEIVSTQNW